MTECGVSIRKVRFQLSLGHRGPSGMVNEPPGVLPYQIIRGVEVGSHAWARLPFDSNLR